MFQTLITATALAAQLGDPAWIVVDVRHDLAQPDHWGDAQYRTAHLPGARFAHIDRDLSAPKTGRNGRHPLPPPDVCAARFGALGIGPGCQVVAYDQNNGMFAARLWWMLRWLGHDAVAVLDGGIDAWQREGRPVTADVAAVLPRPFIVSTLRRTADAAEIAAALGSSALMVVDARAPERFRGEVEPLDPVAGHIPGAVNRPYALNVTADGRFRPASELRSAFLQLVAGQAVDRVVHQCGSGVTACHNILAMEIAGLGGTRLYPGSWSEWCADPARPVALG
jgi:thiosulfate/3-mercaptopyruvate sulfurtransferase